MDKAQREPCPHCDKTYASKDSLRKHLILVDYKKPTINQVQISAQQDVLLIINQYPALSAEILNLWSIDQSISMVDGIKSLIKSTGYLSNPIQPIALQVQYLTQHDDLLQILIDQMGLKGALSYIRDCVVSKGLFGDCELLARIYLDTPKPALMYSDNNKTDFVYYDKDQKKVVETNFKVIAKLLAENLLTCYQKGLGSFIDENGNCIVVNDNHPYLPRIEANKIQLWHNRLLELNKEKYQGQILQLLPVPIEQN